jgi:hypothetical protein
MKAKSFHNSYIQDLVLYLESFLSRSQPLINLDEKKLEFLEQFEKKWENVEFKEYQNVGKELFCQACTFIFSLFLNKKKFSILITID